MTETSFAGKPFVQADFKGKVTMKQCPEARLLAMAAMPAKLNGFLCARSMSMGNASLRRLPLQTGNAPQPSLAEVPIETRHVPKVTTASTIRMRLKRTNG